MNFVEETDTALSAEQLAAAEAEIEHQKREWEMGRLQAMKEEEERRLRLADEDDDSLLTFSRVDSKNQVNNNSGSGKIPVGGHIKGRENVLGGKEIGENHDSGSRSDDSESECTIENDTPTTSDGECGSGSESDLDVRVKRRYSKQYSNNHVTSNNSPRTRSRGSVSINLWTLDVSPILPGVKPIGEHVQEMPMRGRRRRGSRFHRGGFRGRVARTVGRHHVSGGPSLSCNNNFTVSSYSNPNLVIRTRRASVTPCNLTGNVENNSVTFGDSMELTLPRKANKMGRFGRKSEGGAEGNGPIT